MQNNPVNVETRYIKNPKNPEKIIIINERIIKIIIDNLYSNRNNRKKLKEEINSKKIEITTLTTQ